MTNTIRVGLVGIGNCAASLVQGVAYYQLNDTSVGLMHPVIGGYGGGDLDFVAAFDVDSAKVGLTLDKAIYAGPNCPVDMATVPPSPTVVTRGARLDGVGAKYAEKIDVDDVEENRGAEFRRIVETLRDARVDVLVNYLPVGSQEATEFYAHAALAAGCAFVNSIPVYIARRPEWRELFADAGLPLVGDDIKSQVGATIVHRALAELISSRGFRLDQTYQLNVGGNMDFYNMLERSRLETKKDSKTSAVTSALQHEIAPTDVHIGPSDYVPWLGDHKLAFIRCQMTGFGGTKHEIELRMDVVDSPNSAGVVMDAVRCAAVAKEQGIGGALEDVSAWLMKAPPAPMPDGEARAQLQRFVDVAPSG